MIENTPTPSQHSSDEELSDDDTTVSRTSRESLDKAEEFITRACQDTEMIKTECVNLKSLSQIQSRRIHDLRTQFKEARVRIDILKSLRSRSWTGDSEYTSSKNHFTDIQLEVNSEETEA